MYPGAHAATNPDHLAVVMVGSGRTITYGQLDDNSARLASALNALGLVKGDVVAMLTDNAAECFEIYWACMRSGLYITPVNRYLTAEEIAYIVNDSGAKALIASSAVPTVAEVRELSPQVEHAFVFGGDVDGYASYADLLANAGERLIDQPRGSDMMYSSGTTGRPKGVKQAMLPIQVDQPGDPITGLLGGPFKVGPQDVYLQPAPVYHAAPLKWSGAVQALGGTVVMMEKFDAEGALAAIEKYGVTCAQFVPTMFVRMLQLPEEVRAKYKHDTMRLAVHAAAPCPPDVKQAMIDWWGPVVFEYYGSTEQNGITFVSSPEWLAKRGTVGKAMIGVLHICDDEGNELPAGEVGTVYFERETRPFEYHNDPAKTAEATHPQHESWTAVGDLGYVDEDGYLYLTDRKSFTIISGGVNIYPAEVEAVLTLHPAIFDVAVIGVPDAEMGQQVKAVVQLKDGVEGTPELAQELIDYTRERIAHFKAPRSVDFIAEIPRLPTGKLLKRELEKLYVPTGV
ncbi:fatty-acyl-CoA synthase [Nocardioides sp. J9]|uniref:acyl-CoA synthetase n=1 Tax=Nocardioides sp. J9 TaxID=935844 RepID=UPI0011A42542|nr:acyl-CoA synthetase [Nocardioides sp. J9]TWG89684.1 fatty-acyl-CoA synthase [Nocardioides sp. J9]